MKTHRVVTVGKGRHAVHQMVINRFRPGAAGTPFEAVHEHVTMGTITPVHQTDTQRLRALRLR